MNSILRGWLMGCVLLQVVSVQAQNLPFPEDQLPKPEDNPAPLPPSVPPPSAGHQQPDPPATNDGVIDMSSTGFSFPGEFRAGFEGGQASAAKNLSLAKERLIRLLAFTMVCPQDRKHPSSEASTKLYYIKEAFKGYRDEVMAGVGKNGASLPNDSPPRNREAFQKELQEAIRAYKVDGVDSAKVLDAAGSTKPYLEALGLAAEAVTKVSFAKLKEDGVNVDKETGKKSGIDATMKGNADFASLKVFNKSINPGQPLAALAKADKCSKDYAKTREQTRTLARVYGEDRKTVESEGKKVSEETRQASREGARDYAALARAEKKLKDGNLSDKDRKDAQALVERIRTQMNGTDRKPATNGYIAGFGPIGFGDVLARKQSDKKLNDRLDQLEKGLKGDLPQGDQGAAGPKPPEQPKTPEGFRLSVDPTTPEVVEQILGPDNPMNADSLWKDIVLPFAVIMPNGNPTFPKRIDEFKFEQFIKGKNLTLQQQEKLRRGIESAFLKQEELSKN